MLKDSSKKIYISDTNAKNLEIASHIKNVEVSCYRDFIYGKYDILAHCGTGPVFSLDNANKIQAKITAKGLGIPLVPGSRQTIDSLKFWFRDKGRAHNCSFLLLLCNTPKTRWGQNQNHATPQS